MRIAKFALLIVALTFPLMAAQAETDYLFFLGQDYHHLNSTYWYPSVASQSAPGTWHIQNLPTTNFVSGALVGLPVGSTPYCFFFSGNTLTFAYLSGSTWIESNVGTGTPAPLSPNSLTGVSVGGNAYLFYITSNSHIEEIYGAGSSWHYADLTTLTGALLADAGSTIFALYTNIYNVVYVSGQHVIDLSNNGSWHVTDLTGSAEFGAPNANAGTSLTGFIFPTVYSGTWTYFRYMATDTLLHDLVWNGSNWSDENASNLSLAAHAAANTAQSAVAYVDCPYGPSECIYPDAANTFFLDQSQEVNQIRYNGNAWEWENLTSEAGAPAAETAGESLVSFTALGGEEMFYIYGSQIEELRSPANDGIAWSLTGTGAYTAEYCQDYRCTAAPPVLTGFTIP